jgi:AsmA protein
MRKRALIGLSAFLFVLTTFLFIPSLFKEEVSSVLLRGMNKKIDANVSFSGADINLWRNFPNFTFTFNNFLVTGKNHFTGDTLLQTQQLHLAISSWEYILMGKVQLKHLKLQQPQVHVLILSNGEANYNISNGEPADSTSDVSLKIESCEIDGGSLVYDDRLKKVKITSDQIQFNGDFNVEGDITHLEIDGVAKHSNLISGGLRYLVNKDLQLSLNASYDSQTSSIYFENNEIGINDLVVDFDGTYRYAKPGHIVDFKFNTADAKFSDILSLNDMLQKDFKKLNIKGQFTAEGNVKGIYDDVDNLVPTFSVRMKVSDGHLQYKTLTKSLNDVNIQMTAVNTDSIWSHSTFNLTDFSLKLGENPLRGKAMIQGLHGGVVYAEVLGKVKLEDVTSIFPIEGLTLTGNMNVAAEANGRYEGHITSLLAPKMNQRVPAFDTDISLNGASIKYDHLPNAIHDLHLLVKASNTSGIFKKTRIIVDRINGQLGDNPVKGFVHIDGFTNPKIKSELTARLDLSEIHSFLPLEDIDLKGMFDINMKVQGQLNDSLKMFPIVKATLNVKDGFLKSRTHPAPIENAHLYLEAVNETGKIKDTKFIIDTLTYSIDGESFLVEGSISDLEKYNYDLQVNGRLYLEKLNSILSFTQNKMSGEVNVNFHTAGNLSDLKLKRYHLLPTSGQMRMKNIDIEAGIFPHDLLIKDGHLFFSNEKIFLDTLHGAIGKSKFNLTGHLYNYLAYVFHSNEKIRGDLLFESEHFSLNELLSDDIAHRDTVHHDLTTIEIPRNIEFVFDSKIGELEFKDIIADKFRGELIIKDGVLTLNETRFNVLESEFQVTGDYDARDITRPAFDIALKVTDLDINKAHTAFNTVRAIAPAAEHTFGIFSIDYKLKGTLHPNLHPLFESFEGNGTVSIRDAQVNGMKVFHHISGLTKKEALMNPTLKNIVMETNVEKGTFYVKPFSMKLAGFDTDIEGQHDFTGAMNYVLRIAIPPFDLVRIPLHINGTYDNPKIHLGKGHEDAFAKTISYNGN